MRTENYYCVFMPFAHPFVKWAGGKRQLLPSLTKLLPKFNAYHEPFLGGGALYLKLYNDELIKKAYLTDYNKHLVLACDIVKNNLDELLNELSSPRYKNDKETYYEIRRSIPKDRVKQVARFVYLNKTAFNGLYRVNSKGDFNVPFGKYKNPKIIDKLNLRLVSKALQKAELNTGDFSIVLKQAKKDDLVYFDPPYLPVSKTSNFTSYTKNAFGKKDQLRLKETFDKLSQRGCYLMLSNSYHPYIEELYEDYNQEIVYAGRAINCKGSGRGKIRELVIRNW